MMQLLLELDRNIFLFLNKFHNPWLDPIMYWITKTKLWIPLYAYLLYLSIQNYKKKTWIVLVGIGLTILIADQVTSGLMKPYFARLRPSHEPSLQGLIHLVNGYTGGKYGFASGHAANTFGTASFFFLLFRNKYQFVSWLFAWAVLMTYTRIYLGVHYPGDILVGAMIGLLAGWIGYLFVAKIQEKKQIK